MDWTEEVRARLQRNNQILFTRDSLLLRDLRRLLEAQDRRTVILWALALAEEAVETLAARHPAEGRPRQALEAARLWAAGRIKMPAARRAILACHALARELASPADAALCHAIGQACGTVHTPGHALGFPIYELTAIVRSAEDWPAAVERRNWEYIESLLYRRAHGEDAPREWADFLPP